MSQNNTDPSLNLMVKRQNDNDQQPEQGMAEED